MARTVLLIDGNSLTYRAFFALPTDMATASGQVTNAVYGFTQMLVNLLRDHKPDAIAVTVTCHMSTADLTGLGLPGTLTGRSTAHAVIDTHRVTGVGP